MLIIGIAGGSGSGKSTVVREIISRLPDRSVTIIPQDAYYRDNSHLSVEERRRINFDHPSSIEFSLLDRHLSILAQGLPIALPQYSYITCTRSEETIRVVPAGIVIVEGILIFTDEAVRNRIDIKVFVDAEADERLMRIIRRDTLERGRSYEDVLKHYETFVKPMHNQFIEPSKRYADIIVPQGGHNEVAIEVFANSILQRMNQ